ncbi:MAG: hypothetical protein ACTH0V_00585 [Microbacteriaceae bacterium]
MSDLLEAPRFNPFATREDAPSPELAFRSASHAAMVPGEEVAVQARLFDRSQPESAVLLARAAARDQAVPGAEVAPVPGRFRGSTVALDLLLDYALFLGTDGPGVTMRSHGLGDAIAVEVRDGDEDQPGDWLVVLTQLAG